MIKKEYHHGDLRRALMDAALGHLGTNSVQTLTFRDLARSVGVTPGAPYHHFKDRDELLAHLAAEGFEKFNRRMTEIREEFSGQDRAADADMLTVGVLRHAREHWAYYRVMFRNENMTNACKEIVSPLADDTFDCMLGMLEAFGVPESLRTFRSAEIWALIHGLLMLSVEGPLDERVPPEHFELLACDGVRVLLGISQ